MSKEQLPDLLFDDKSTADCLQKDKTSSVYRGYWKGNTAAITFYKDFSEEKFLKLRNQTRALEPVFKKTQHIVKIFDLRYDDACLVMEYVTKNSTLENCIETKSTSVTSAEKETKYDEIKQEVKDISRTAVSTWPLDLRLRISLDIVNGLQALHENKIAHPDFTIKNILLNILPNKPLIAKLLIKPQYQEQKRNLKENLFSTNIQALGEILHKIFLNPTLDIPPTVDILISQCYEPNPKNRPSLDEFQRTLTTLLKSQPYSERTKEIEDELWKQHEKEEDEWRYRRCAQNKIYSLVKDFDLVLESKPDLLKILDINIIQKLEEIISSYMHYMRWDFYAERIDKSNRYLEHMSQEEIKEYSYTMQNILKKLHITYEECSKNIELLQKAKEMIQKRICLLEEEQNQHRRRLHEQYDQKYSKVSLFNFGDLTRSFAHDNSQVYTFDQQYESSLREISNPLRYQVHVLKDGLKIVEKDVHLPSLNLEDEKTYKKIIKIICDKFKISEWTLNMAIGFYLKPEQFKEFKKQVKLDKRRQNFFKLRDDYLKIDQSMDDLFFPYDEKNKDQDYIRLNTLLLRQLFATLNYLIEMAIAKYPDWLGSNKEAVNKLIDKFKLNISVSGFDEHFTLIKSMLTQGETYTGDNYQKMTKTLDQQFTVTEFEIYQGFLSLIAENMVYFKDIKEIRENIFFIELSKFISDLDKHFNEISEMNDTVFEIVSNYKNNFSRLEIRKLSDETLVQNIYSDQLYLINSKLEQKPKPEEKEQLLKIKQNILKKQQKILEKQENLKKQMGEVSYDLLINKNKLVLQGRHLEKNLLTLQQDLNELAYKINLFFKKNPGAQSKSIALFDEMNEIIKVIIEDFLRKISKNSITTDKINLINKIMVGISGYIGDINGIITRNQSPEVSQGLKSSLFVQMESKYQTQQKENEQTITNKITSIKDILQKLSDKPMNSFVK